MEQDDRLRQPAADGECRDGTAAERSAQYAFAVVSIELARRASRTLPCSKLSDEHDHAERRPDEREQQQLPRPVTMDHQEWQRHG